MSGSSSPFFLSEKGLINKIEVKAPEQETKLAEQTKQASIYERGRWKINTEKGEMEIMIADMSPMSHKSINSGLHQTLKDTRTRFSFRSCKGNMVMGTSWSRSMVNFDLTSIF